MIFQINKKATLPIIKMELINDGRNDYNHFMDLIQNSETFFCMTNIENGVKKISMQPASCEKKDLVCGDDYDCNEEYYLTYRWRPRDTKIPGTYKGEFIIRINDDLTRVINGNPTVIPGGDLIVPIREELFIHVLEGSIKK